MSLEKDYLRKHNADSLKEEVFPRALRRDSNRLSLIVANSLYNLICGKPRKSGLIGPVEIFREPLGH